ncbi:hypothetical protein Aab01nite_11700 [Paractinoplanes abujensis]|nr:hypothetical protein Aab01nite_11700 [Actinoplanes abujensis]
MNGLVHLVTPCGDYSTESTISLVGVWRVWRETVRTLDSRVVSEAGGVDMRDELRGLHERAGKPTQGALKQHADAAGHDVGRSTLIAVVSPTARGNLKWQTVAAFIDGCLRYADKNRGLGLLPDDVDIRQWRLRWAGVSGTK